MVLGSGIRDPGSGKNLFRIPDPGSRGQKAPNPGSRIRIRNTGPCMLIRPSSVAYDLFKGEAASVSR
jgi:hypothetical protein